MGTLILGIIVPIRGCEPLYKFRHDPKRRSDDRDIGDWGCRGAVAHSHEQQRPMATRWDWGADMPSRCTGRCESHWDWHRNRSGHQCPDRVSRITQLAQVDGINRLEPREVRIARRHNQAIAPTLRERAADFAQRTGGILSDSPHEGVYDVVYKNNSVIPFGGRGAIDIADEMGLLKQYVDAMPNDTLHSGKAFLIQHVDRTF